MARDIADLTAAVPAGADLFWYEKAGTKLKRRASISELASVSLGYTPVNRAGDTMTGPLMLTPSGADYIVSSRSGYTFNHANFGNGQFGIWDTTASAMSWLYDTASGGVHRFRGQVEESGYRVWSEARFNPATKLDARNSLGIVAANPPGNNWNNADQNGWYMGDNLTNSPWSGWSMCRVTQHNGDWIQQEAFNFTHGPESIVARRRKLAGTWTAWSTEVNQGVTRIYAADGHIELDGGANTNNINRKVNIVHNKSVGHLGFYDARVGAWIARWDDSNNFFAPNNVYAAGWFRSQTSGIGWYHEVHGGGWYMTDNTWIRNYNGKGLLIAGGGGGGDFRIESVSPTITCYDTDDDRSSWIHYNGGQHGFLQQNIFAWGAYRTSGNDWACVGNVIAYASDRRLKKNIEDVNEGFVDRFFRDVRIRKFDWDSEALARNHIGFKPLSNQIGGIAQEFQAVYPDMVGVNEAHNPIKTEENPNPEKPDFLTIDWQKAVPLLIAKVQQQERRINALEGRF